MDYSHSENERALQIVEAENPESFLRELTH